MGIERCRIWWPRQELQFEHEPFSTRLILFGWLFTSTDSLDIVISMAVPQDLILRSFATLDTLQVILYEVPKIGRNHFSLGVGEPRKLKASFKKPNWINDLHKLSSFLDLGSIVLALNCSYAARVPVTCECSTSSSGAYFVFSFVYDVFLQVTWHCMGIFLASTSTILYIMILLFRKCLSHMSQYLMLHKVFRHSWNNIHLRSCQILYWPIVLQDTSLSSTVNVEYAHRAAIQKHALWSSIAVDLLMGFVLGAAFLLNTQTICIWITALVHHMTDAILRSGCVWLMGVPAGFKLNTELAELLGMISLNAIQIYSTLWFFVGACYIARYHASLVNLIIIFKTNSDSCILVASFQVE
ncbi:hypothetical protein U9M48_010668 [Paspalum notatum var. saurae]|uniref:Uncharacterized protein n=1 Tax=Paspalum notatum var. saurae TaxID=547442 RepID=A0AAQ3WGB5_PASNO